MKLRYIGLNIGYESGIEDPFRDNFNLGVNFINYYLSKSVRRLKLETDGNYNSIHVEPNTLGLETVEMVPEKTLHVFVKFNMEYYSTLDDYERNLYAMKLLESGYNLIKNKGFLSIEKLIDLNEGLIISSFKNIWSHKKRKFKDQKLEVELICNFSRYSFEVRILIKQSSEILINEVLIKTLPAYVCFYPLFRDVILLDDKIVVTEFQNRPKFILKLSDVLNRTFKVEVDNSIGLRYLSESA